MMTNRRMLDYVNAEPFRPFRIKMVSGETFDVVHPEMIFLSRTTARLFGPSQENNGTPSERERELSILLIESIEPLKSSVQDSSHQDGN